MSSSTLQICTAVLVSVTFATNSYKCLGVSGEECEGLVQTFWLQTFWLQTFWNPGNSEPLKCGHLNSTDVLLRYGLHSYKHIQPYIIT